jgi:hypothetical protein
MVVNEFEKSSGGKPVKVKVIDRFGVTCSGTDRYSGEVFETDEYTSRLLVRQGRLALVVEETAAPSPPEAPPDPGAGEQPASGDPAPEPASEKPARGRRGHE